MNFVVKFRGEHIRVRPEEIGGHIVRTLRENVERNITAPKQAVVSVPAEFGELQRNMTRKAVNLAGKLGIGELDLHISVIPREVTAWRDFSCFTS